MKTIALLVFAFLSPVMASHDDDGLKEQAMMQARSLKFGPALNSGKPVACWLLFEVDYYLQSFRRVFPKRHSETNNNDT